MLFNSYIFVLCFLPVSVAGYFCLNRLKKYRLAECFLLGMSLWFYGYFNICYLPIMLISILGNWAFSCLIAKTGKEKIKKLLLFLAVAINIGSIFYFKYYDFFIDNINRLFKTNFNLLNLVLPLGISFFTFQQISFQIDHYRENVKYDFLQYALFVSFFPQLVAGPIVTHDEIIPQFADRNRRIIFLDNIGKGIISFTFGLSKKVLIADAIGNVANCGFSNIAGLDTTNAVLVMLAYTFQIYFDFSGYSDMATGIGYMFNIELPSNFDSPYKSYSINEFWKKWHMTLTRFLRHYIYIPLGGNRKGKIRVCANILIVYLFSGLWHGANWTFILWGGVHGAACILDRLFGKHMENIHPALKWMVTFTFINIAWVYFRADSIASANGLLYNLIHIQTGPVLPEITSALDLPELVWMEQMGISPTSKCMLIYLTLLCMILGAKNTRERVEKFHYSVRSGVLTGCLFVWNILSFSGVSTFLYFNF